MGSRKHSGKKWTSIPLKLKKKNKNAQPVLFRQENE